ncbi:MAG: 50S ribosomal protein L29 [Armatimonadota bacterium]|nr:50S ribosomal protein L29 [Armatimonadota bacterium]
MKALNAKELRGKKLEDLQDMLNRERAALYEDRRKLVFREDKDTNVVKNRRHNVARILTLITEMKRGNK